MPVSRFLTPADLSAAAELSAIAGWNQTMDDWQILLELAPEGCFGIEADGRIVATATLVCYRARVAWIGMVLTHPDFRGRGFARQLVNKTLARARRLEVETIKLDATAAGRPLYESLGFVPEQAVERWMRKIGVPGNRDTILPSPLRPVTTLDREACAHDRASLLHLLAARSQTASVRDGYLLHRPGRICHYLGPCVARHPGVAVQLISQCVQDLSTAAWFWDLLPANETAAALAAELGFIRQRELTRMRLGADLRCRDEWIYAIAGFEFG